MGSIEIKDSLRSMAILWNFHPYGLRTTYNSSQRISPFHDINGFVYNPNWLQNYLIASSLSGRRM